MSLSFEGNVKSIKKVDSPINATDGEASNALIQDAEAKNGEFSCSNNKLHQSLVDDDLSPLCGKPYYNCIVAKTHLHKQCQMVFPAKLHPDLPAKTVPAVVNCRGKAWNMMFLGGSTKKRLDTQSWKRFAGDNNLKVGDALFWEVMEKGDENVTFKVQIIQGDFPSELAARVNGKTEDTPIIID